MEWHGPVYNEGHPRLIAPSLHELMAQVRCLPLSLRLGGSLRATASMGGWDRLRCPGRRRTAVSAAHLAESTDPQSNPVSPRRAIASHREKERADVPALRIRR